MLSLAQTMKNNKICDKKYADNTQIYITISPAGYNHIQALGKCIKQISDWIFQNFLQLNKDKTEVSVSETRKKD